MNLTTDFTERKIFLTFELAKIAEGLTVSAISAVNSKVEWFESGA
jgi:hypothetical protein